MLERTQIFVDTSYLLASFYNSWETGARSQLEIDLPEVVSVLGRIAQDQIKQPIHRQFWYDGIPESGPHRYQRSLRSEPGVQLRSGQLIEWGDRRTQKAVDTRLVADMVLAAVRGNISDLVLVSGDADMLPGVEEAVNAGIRVHLYGFGWDSMSSQLRFACDTTTILDPREDFKDTMRLQVLEGPLPANATGTPSPGESLGEDCTTPEFKPLGDAQKPETPGPSPIPEPEHKGKPKPGPRTPSQPVAEDSVQAPAPSVPHPGAARTAAAGEPVTARAPEDSEPESPETPDVPEAKENAVEVGVQKKEDSRAENSAESTDNTDNTNTGSEAPKPKPNPSMMARHRKLRSRYVPLPNEVWASAGEQNPYDIGQQYAVWWFDNAADETQKDSAHLLSGGGLPPEIDRPLLQFACETLHAYTLSEAQRVGLRDGFHSGIRGIMLRDPRS